MVELQTLKELRGYWMPNQVKARKFRMILESDLKQEAIKLVKHLKKESTTNFIYSSSSGSISLDGGDDSINILKFFFNITDEDLK